MKPLKSIQLLSSILWTISSLGMGALLPDLSHPAIARAQFASLGRPKHRKPGAKKGGCLGSPLPGELTAIVPETGDDLTVSDSPTLLFLIPEAPHDSLKAVFRLQVNNRNVAAPLELAIAGTPGIIKVKVPKSLEKNQPYQWLFQITCGSEKSLDLRGTVIVRAASPRLIKQLGNTHSLREKAAVYAREGLWLDAVATLADAQTRDLAVRQDWQTLLQTLGLPELQQQPIVPCCTIP